MKQKKEASTLALEFATNMFGVINPDVKKRLQAVIRNPNQKTWENAYSLILSKSGGTTLWQAVLKVDWSLQNRKPIDEPWSHIPSSEKIIEAIKLVVFEQNKINSN